MSAGDQQQQQPGLPRSTSNPFTKNQDAPGYYDDDSQVSVDERDQLRSLARHMRKLSMSNSAVSNSSDTFDLPAFRDAANANANAATAAASGSNGALTPRADPNPRPVALEPVGGARFTPHRGDLPDADKAYGEDQDSATLLSGSLGKSSNLANLPEHGIDEDKQRVLQRARGVVRTYSMGQQKRRPQKMNDDPVILSRRMSHDAVQEAPRRFIVDVEETMRLVLEQEDTDGNFQICITDSGPKVLTLGTATSNGYKGFDIRGTYMLSNLLQELALAREHGRKRIVLDESRLTENPVDRLSRMISQTFWHNLTRRIDGDGLDAILSDPKNRSKSQNPRIYVPASETEMLRYYQKVAEERPSLNLTVEALPHSITAEYTRDLNDKPGLLALAMRDDIDPTTGEKRGLKGIPFVVPGARFNELYNWDSYFISLGLVVDNMVDLAKGTVDHFIFEIKHYGKILNGNRTYYLMRAQPPFLTDMALQVYSRLDPANEADNKEWLRKAIQAAIKEYHTVWMSKPRFDHKTWLSRYRPEGLGVPPETEASHFTHILRPYAEKHGVSVNEFTRKYNHGEIKEPELDTYFMHDRAVRESGHDTTYRFERKCADLATIDLNALLYKYEVDIATAIREVFDDRLELEDDFLLHGPLPPSLLNGGSGPAQPSRSIETPQTSAEWFARAAHRKAQVDKYLWNDGMGLYFDYDTRLEEPIVYESVTSFWAMWAGMASEDQAAKLVQKSLKRFEEQGGLVSGTEDSRGKISLDRPNRQWDWPYAWPPHNVLAWVGLERYGYLEEARRLAYRWLYMMTVAFVDFNGTVPEKFDAVNLSHMVDAEYGNQGIDFKCVPREGFGWMNSSFQVGLTFLTTHQRRAVAALQHPDEFFNLRRQAQRGTRRQAASLVRASPVKKGRARTAAVLSAECSVNLHSRQKRKVTFGWTARPSYKEPAHRSPSIRSSASTTVASNRVPQLPTILAAASPLRTAVFKAPSSSRFFASVAACSLRPSPRASIQSSNRTSRLEPHIRPFSTSISMSDDNAHKDGFSKWSNKDGHFRRQESSFRSSIEKDGKHQPEVGRYHLVVALACPWAHRALIVRKLKGIDQVPDLLPVHVVDSLLGDEGWSFVPYDEPKGLGVPGTGNHIPGHEDKKRIRELYKVADPEYSQRCTVPVIWDAKLNTIVNNESSEVIRNLNYAFDELIPQEFRGKTFYPEASRSEIDAFHEWVYPNINNGVYKCGFATTQEAYESNVGPLFDSLDRVEKMLADGRTYLYADTLTEADIRLYTTIVRFDPVYFTHFKCNLRTIRDGYPHINKWMQNLYWNNPAFKDTTDFDSIKAHYFQSHININPNRIVPQGPLPHILPLN